MLPKLRTILRGIPSVHRFFALLRGGAARRSELLRLEKPDNLFQPFGFTQMNRYRRLFDFLRETLGDDESMHLLSFGCASGEEAFSLRSRFPRATIRGLDIDQRAIALCQAKLKETGDVAMSFDVANSAVAEPLGRYHLILALSVFRHGELQRGPAVRCDHLIRFADFERTVNGLVDCLHPDGLLVVHNANFRFRDTAVARGFETVYRSPRQAYDPRTPLYGPNDELLPAAFDNEVVFQRRSFRLA